MTQVRTVAATAAVTHERMASANASAIGANSNRYDEPAARMSSGWNPVDSSRATTPSAASPISSQATTSAPRRTCHTWLRGGQDLGAGVGDDDRVLPLRRKRAVLGEDGPAVVPHPPVLTAEGEHRLDREGHAGLENDVRARVV